MPSGRRRGRRMWVPWPRDRAQASARRGGAPALGAPGDPRRPVAATWLLALVIDVHPGDCACHFGIGWAWRAALVATIGAVWLLAFGGWAWWLPRPLFAAAIAVPAAALNAARGGALAILFILLGPCTPISAPSMRWPRPSAPA